MKYFILTICCFADGPFKDVTATEPPVTALEFSSGDAFVATSQAGLQIHGWPDLKRQRTIECSAANLHCLAFSPDNKHLAVGGGNPAEDGTVEIFSWPSGRRVVTLSEHKDSVRAIAWQGSSKLVSAGVDREIKLWDISDVVNRKADSKPPASVRTLKGHSRSVSSLCVLRDGTTLISAGDDQSVRVWNLKTGELIRSLNQHTGSVHDLAARPGQEGLSMVASAAGDRTIRFWQPTIGRLVRYIRLSAEPLSIAWTNDGTRIVAACVDGQLRVIDPDEVTVVSTHAALNGWAYASAVHPTRETVLVGGSNGQLRRFELMRR